jgi:hypothetical protein
MYKLDLPVDMREQAAIERRRRLEKERQARIFNNKHRLIGVDLEALEQQKQDKMFMEEIERKRSEAFGKQIFDLFFCCCCWNTSSKSKVNFGNFAI